jgi:excisionase family DNA binding protein
MNFQGPYKEDYEDLPDSMKENRAGWTGFRVGRIYDTAKNRVATFRQAVQEPNDPTPDGLCAWDDPYSGHPAWSDGANGSTNCAVWDFSVRPLTEEDRRNLEADSNEKHEPNKLTISQAANYANVTERTIRNWIDRKNGDSPMLDGVTGTGRLTRIPKSSLAPYCKPIKATRKTKATHRKRNAQKQVKRKS